eukprot:10936095-Alexandrium_andersonii.AAC.1
MSCALHGVELGDLRGLTKALRSTVACDVRSWAWPMHLEQWGEGGLLVRLKLRFRDLPDWTVHAQDREKYCEAMGRRLSNLLTIVQRGQRKNPDCAW